MRGRSWSMYQLSCIVLLDSRIGAPQKIRQVTLSSYLTLWYGDLTRLPDEIVPTLCSFDKEVGGAGINRRLVRRGLRRKVRPEHLWRTQVWLGSGGHCSR